MRLFWLSFADATKPKGTQFLGACMVKGFDEKDAVTEAHRQGCNPGGEVLIADFTDDMESIHPSWLNVLMDKATIEAHDSVEAWGSPRPN